MNLFKNLIKAVDSLLREKCFYTHVHSWEVKMRIEKFSFYLET